MFDIKPYQPQFTYTQLRKLPDVLTYYYGYKMTTTEVSKHVQLRTNKVSDLIKVYGRGFHKKVKRENR